MPHLLKRQSFNKHTFVFCTDWTAAFPCSAIEWTMFCLQRHDVVSRQMKSLGTPVEYLPNQCPSVIYHSSEYEGYSTEALNCYLEVRISAGIGLTCQ